MLRKLLELRLACRGVDADKNSSDLHIVGDWVMFEKTVVRGLVAVVLTATMIGGIATADVILSPYETTPGNTYQIAFVTAGYTTAESSDIDYYNSFVASQAALGTSLPTTTWTALGSTQTVSAIDNAPTYGNIPIYNTLGQLVASGSAELWSGVLENPIDGDQYGSPPTLYVWTGTLSDGTSSPGYLGSGYATIGLTNTGYAFSFAGDPTGNTLSMYALSSPITAVPEPATLTLLGSALLGLGVVYLRRRSATRASINKVCSTIDASFRPSAVYVCR